MNVLRISGAVALLLPALLAAQAPAAAPAPVTDPVSAAARGMNKRYSGFLTAAADAVPADMPKVTGTDSKDKLVSALKASFTYCDGVLAKQTDSNLGETVDLGFMKATRAQALFIYTGDLVDHYSQIANYMRINGMLPPSAQPKKAM